MPTNMNIPPPNLQQQQQQLGGENKLPSLLTLKVDPPDQLTGDVNNDETGEVILAQALEEVLALKNQRERELAMEDTNNIDAAQNKITTEDDEVSVRNFVGILVFKIVF